MTKMDRKSCIANASKLSLSLSLSLSRALPPSVLSRSVFIFFFIFFVSSGSVRVCARLSEGTYMLLVVFLIVVFA